LRTDHAGDFLDQKVPHLMIKGAKAVEFEDQRLMSLSGPVAVIGEVKVVLRKV
jgi:hypothetical protein